MKTNLLLAVLGLLASEGLVQTQAFKQTLRRASIASTPVENRSVPPRLWKEPESHTPTYGRLDALHASSSEPTAVQKLDVDALAKYSTALATQMALFAGIFKATDYALTLAPFQVPFAVNCVLFWMVALRSRVLNPLNNSRPKTDNLETEGSAKRNMPTWTPPGFIFPIMWILIIGPIRAATTAMVYNVTGSYANIAILSLMLHLSIGDCWNSVNNVERRYGASVVGGLLVWLSNAHAAYQYSQVSPVAGQLLCIPLVWLTVASALIIRTWQLNPDPQSGEPYPLYPVEGQAKTDFVWFQKSS